MKSRIDLFICVTLFFLASSFQSSAQALEKDIRYILNTSNQISVKRAQTALSDNYDISYHRLNLEADPDIHYIKGEVTTYFGPNIPGMQSIDFDFRSNMTIDSIVYHGLHLNHSFPDNITLRIQFPSPLQQNTLDSLSIFYRGAPYVDGFGSFVTGQSDCQGDHPILWTLSEPFGAKCWWPCKESLNDKVDSVDLFVTTPEIYRVAGNGLLMSEVLSEGKKTFHWKHRYPIPAYLVAFAIAEYAVFSDYVDIPGGTGQIEVLNYVFPCNQTYASNQTPLLDPIFKFFIERFGPYPFENEKYGHAECGFGGGMEHSTMSFMGGFGVSLMAHELAHQWFGDKITCGTWNDIWLNEGFATYLDGLTCEQQIGYTSWSNWKNNMINSVTNSNSGSTYVYDASSVSNIFNYKLVYQKGALILHMLRWILGDDDFFEAILNYISDPELVYDYALTPNLQSHLEMISGKDLSEFFADWLYGEGWPNYSIEWSYDDNCNQLHVSINQTHSANQGNFFEMPVPIMFSDGTEDSLLVFHQDSPDKTDFFVNLDFEPNSVTFDPDKWLCAKSIISSVSPYLKQITWTGAIDYNWENPANWDCGIPTSEDLVFIPAGLPCVILPFSAAECKKITLEEGCKFQIWEFGSLTIYD